MTTKHTPGPWRVLTNLDSQQRHRIGADDGGIAIICIRRTMGSDGPSPSETANARLIAAAPALLEALEECEYKLSALNGVGVPEVLIKARAAIKQAKGE